jgi:hypothetical protein
MGIGWQINLRHNNHFHVITTLSGNHQEFNVLPTSCAEDEVYWYEIILTVTDPGGLTDTKSVMIYPDCDEVLDESNTPKNESFLLLPNPAKNLLTLRSDVNLNSAFDYRIVDARGQIVRSELLPVFNGRRYVELPIADLASGFYILSFRLGGEWKQARFVKMDD